MLDGGKYGQKNTLDEISENSYSGKNVCENMNAIHCTATIALRRTKLKSPPKNNWQRLMGTSNTCIGKYGWKMSAYLGENG